MRLAIAVLLMGMCACGKREVVKEDVSPNKTVKSESPKEPTMNPLSILTRIKNTLPFVSSSPVEWEHGWKTPRVTATRMTNEAMGDFVKLDFPENRYDSDRAEVSEFIESKDGWIFEGGGYPGAPAYVKFKGVTDRASTDKTLREILPALDALMRDITDGKPIPKPPQRKILDKNGKEWPECVPPYPDDPFGKLNNNLNVNGTPYLCSPEGRWVVDQEAVEYERKLRQQFT